MSLTSKSVHASALILATALALFTVTNGLAVAKEGPVAERATSKLAGESATPPGAKASRPHDQRRQSDHRGSDDKGQGNAGRGAGPDHDIYRGSRLPSRFHNDRTYVVDDWRAHRLSAPPRGHHWVQLGADYVLIAIVSGVVVQTLVLE